MGLNRDLRDAFEIFGIRRDHDIHVLCSSNNSPGIDREASNQNKLDVCLGEPAEKLIEGWLGQVRAAPTNRSNW